MRRASVHAGPVLRRPTIGLVVAVVLVAALSGGVASQPAAAGLVPDPPRGDTRIVVFGDFNGPYGSLTYPSLAIKALDAIVDVWRPDLFLSAGDVIAGQQRSLPDTAFAAMWQAFDREIALPLRGAGIPYAVAVGNHDASSLRDRDGAYLFARERAAATDYWSDARYLANLAYLERSNYPFDYAFVAGALFIAVMDASSSTVTAAQRAWLESVLALPQARAARLRLVVGHLPLVPVAVGRDKSGEFITDASSLRELMEAGGVGLYISGHQAAFYPGRLGELELLFAGGVGGRRLLAGTAAPRSTVTLIDVWHEPLTLAYSTFDLATMALVTAAELPVALGSPLGEILRSEWAEPKVP